MSYAKYNFLICDQKGLSKGRSKPSLIKVSHRRIWDSTSWDFYCDDYLLLTLTRGNFRCHIGDKEWTVGPGEVLLVPPRVELRAIPELEACEMIQYFFDPSLVECITGGLGLTETEQVARGLLANLSSTLHGTIQDFREEVESLDDPAMAREICTGLFDVLLDPTICHSRELFTKEEIEQLRAVAKDTNLRTLDSARKLVETRLPLAEVVDTLKVKDRDNFFSLFQEVWGTNFQAYAKDVEQAWQNWEQMTG